MGIYIKKMEMPESCYYCPFADGVWQKDKRCLINGKEMPRDGRDVQQNHINCPLVPVPHHGRLIDADALKAKQQEDADLFIGSRVDIKRRDEALNAVANIVNAPTIIPAEEGE